MAKGKGFWFKFNPVDFIGGTDLMTHEQAGAYIRLLCYQFTDKGTLTMRRIKFVLGADFERLWPELQDKFVEVEGGFLNERLAVEMDHIAVIATQNRQNGALGGRPKKTERLLNEKPNGYEKNNRSNSNSISNSDSSMDETKGESIVIPMNDDTRIFLAGNSAKNSEAAKIEKEFRQLFDVNFEQKGNPASARAALVQAAEQIKQAERLPLGLACEKIVEQAARWRICTMLEGTARKFWPNCETWLIEGGWQKDYEALAESIRRDKAKISEKPLDIAFNQSGAEIL